MELLGSGMMRKMMRMKMKFRCISLFAFQVEERRTAALPPTTLHKMKGTGTMSAGKKNKETTNTKKYEN